jgi:hypothetical protein
MSAIRSLYGNEPIGVELRNPYRASQIQSEEFLGSPDWSVEGMQRPDTIRAPMTFIKGRL